MSKRGNGVRNECEGAGWDESLDEEATIKRRKKQFMG